MTLIHARFGKGEVKAQNGNTITVVFDNGVTKELDIRFAPLKNIDGSDFFKNEVKETKTKKSKHIKNLEALVKAEEFRANNPVKALVSDLMYINNAQAGDRNGSIATLWIDIITPIGVKARATNNTTVVDILAKAFRSFRISEKQALVVATFWVNNK